METLPKSDVPAADQPDDKFEALNRSRNEPVVYVKLEEDVLRPKRQLKIQDLPLERVGPFELRGETLAAALELVLDGKNIPLAFETNAAMTRTITVTQLQGPMSQVVDKLCSLADLYCSYENGTLNIKETETFTVSLPPLIADSYDPFVNGLQAITGGQTYVDALTSSLIYTTTHRNNERAKEYFERIRASTAMIVYEMQIWEVQLNNDRATGIDWDQFQIGVGSRTNLNITRTGDSTLDTNALGVGVQYQSGDISVNAVLNFLQSQGAVKTISQPQLTVLSGSRAKLRIGNSRDYVSQITRTVGLGSNDNVSVTTSTLETGLNLDIGSAWGEGTVYGDLKIALQDLIRISNVDAGGTSIQLPETSDRELETKLRVRPGDAVIIGGIVQERDELSQDGLPGGRKPLFTTSKTKTAQNSELVFMLRPRVVIYTENPPASAQLLQGGIVAESRRSQTTPDKLPATLKPTPLPDAQPAMSNYLEQLPADQIAPAP